MNSKDVINLASLAGIQGGNALIQLLLLPYILYIVGANEFSKIVATESLAFIVLTFTLYSFDVIGVREIVRASSESKREIRKVFFGVIYARIFIFTISSLVVGFVVLVLFEQYFLYFLAWMLFPLGSLLQSSYYYQAIESNFYLSVSVVVSRALACCIGYFFVNSEADSVLAIAIIGSSYLFSGVVSLIYVIFIENSGIEMPNPKYSWELIATGNVTFYGSCSVLLYRSLNVLILASLSYDAKAISIYALAEKYTRILQALTLPLSQLYFSRTISELISTKENVFGTIWRNTKSQVYCSFVFIVVVLVAMHFLSYLFPESPAFEIKFLLTIMSGAVVFGVMNFMFGTVALNTLGKEREYARIVLMVGVISVATCSFLVTYLSAYGAAIGYVFAELLLFILVLITLRKL